MFFNPSSMKRFNLVVGERNSGKTAFLRSLAQKTESDGVLTLSEDASKKSLWAHFIKADYSLPLMKRKAEGAGYLHNSETFCSVNDYLMRLESGIVIIDEIGALELERKEGFYKSLLVLMKRTELRLYISVRDTNLEKLEALIKKECPDISIQKDLDIIFV